jgi:S1 RNA binding domain protein
MSLEIGSIVEGIVTGVTNFGAFVKLPEGNTGLIHISEIANTYVKDVSSFLKEKDNIMVKVIGVNDKGKYDLSLKQAMPEGVDEIQLDPEKPEKDEDFNKDFVDVNNGKVYEKRREEQKSGYDKNSAGKYGYHNDRRENRQDNKDNSFEDKLTKFLKQSEERLLDIKRNTEAKRGRKR